MRDKILSIVHNTLALEQDTPMHTIMALPAIKSVQDLSSLLHLFVDERTSEKELAQAVEAMVVGIKAKKNQATEQEKAFLEQITEIIDKPLYTYRRL